MVSRREVGNAVAAHLAGVTNATGYYGQVGRPLPGVDPATVPADPPPKSPTDPRVRPYFIVYPTAGVPGPDPDLADVADDLTLPLRITAAAGDVEDLLGLIDRIETRLHRWTPTVVGLALGRVVHPIGYAAPPILLGRDVNPHRHYTSLTYQVTATT